MRRSTFLPTLVCTIGIALASLPAAAQVAGFAEITSPSEGSPIAGWVTITGSADHPRFEGYQLAFAYDPNPTDTWFPLTDRVESPVKDDRLALWDTSQISSGTYQLRLSVFTENGKPLTATVRKLTVGGEPAPPAPAQVDAEAPRRPEAPPSSPADERRTPQAQAAVGPSADATLIRIVFYGAGASTVALVGLGIYSFLRPRVRGYAGLLRMRRLRKQQRRRRSQRRS